ncbi:MAG TPA: DEAD/DEAH box helicase [Candidatus Limnocylindrales bacterium]
MSSDQLGFVPERLMSSRRLGPAPERLSSSGESLGGTEPAPERPSSFGQLGLTPELLRAVAAQGYTQPTPVQAQAIPIVLAGRDLLASAQTGTGKTAAFVLPILQLLNASRPAVRYLPAGKGRRGATGLPIRCLVLTPTRELALQVEESVRTYGAERPVRSTIVYGGVGFDPQVRALRGGPEIVVATPGRLLDHAGQGTIDLGSVEILVLDEADRMLDMGFIRDIRRILALLPARRQNLLFSATFSDEIRGLADGLLHLPASVQIARRNSAIELVRQVVYPVDRERKRELLSYLIRSGRIDRALVFTRTKHGANRLAEQLGQDGISAAAIHGNKSQGQRVRALDDFKAGRVAILVATEIAARGLDIESLPHVVNFELPTVAQDYIHRIGRTGRAGLEGDAVSLVCVDENALLLDIETLLRQGIRREVVPGFEVDRSIRREPIRLRSVGANRPNQGHRAPAREPGRVRFGAAPVGIGALPPGFGAARWPNVHRDSPVRVEHAPARGTSAGRPANAGYARPMTSSRPTPSARPLPSARPVPSVRPMPYSRPGGRGVPVVSLPGERIARLGDRPA